MFHILNCGFEIMSNGGDLANFQAYKVVGNA